MSMLSTTLLFYLFIFVFKVTYKPCGLGTCTQTCKMCGGGGGNIFPAFYAISNIYRKKIILGIKTNLFSSEKQ